MTTTTNYVTPNALYSRLFIRSFFAFFLALPLNEHRPRFHGETICYRLNERPHRRRQRDGRLVMSRCTMRNDFCPSPSLCRRARLSHWGTCCVRGPRPSKCYHYANIPIYCEDFLKTVKMQQKIFFLIFTQSIDRAYTLEPPHVPTIFVLE